MDFFKQNKSSNLENVEYKVSSWYEQIIAMHCQKKKKTNKQMQLMA